MIISIKRLSKVFSKDSPAALQDIDAEFSKGKMIGIIGPDGAGKTTLLRLLAALLRPTEGEITIQGFDTVKDSEAVHNVIGYMPQKFGLYEDLTVIQNLNLYADLKGAPKEETFDKLLQFTGLSFFTDRLAKDLSGGMKQKLGLACALITKPQLLLLDEPSVGVDPISRRELWKMTYELVGKEITVVWSTAYLDEAEKCDEVLLLNEGKICYSGKPDGLKARVNNRVFKISGIQCDRRDLLFQLLEDKNTVDGIIQGDNLRIVVQEVKDPLFDIQGFNVDPQPSRFEDGFIDLLGGGPGGVSELASRMATINSNQNDVIVVKNLRKVFGSFKAVDGISFEVKKGEIFGLLGPNGAGKSTSFKMLCGLLKPTSGKAFVSGFDLQKAPSEARRQIGYMAQKFSLYGHLSVYQNLEFFSGIYQLSGKKRQEAIEEMIEVFALSPFLEMSADMLPLGFKQRLALACSNMHHPKILFLDEPTSGVDPRTRREFWNHINGLVQKGVTVLITTHFMDEAEYCDRIALIYGGALIAMDTPEKIKNRAKAETLEDAFIRLVENHDPH
jgi:ABC-2 type transport system ATP-binding protein